MTFFKTVSRETYARTKKTLCARYARGSEYYTSLHRGSRSSCIDITFYCYAQQIVTFQLILPDPAGLPVEGPGRFWTLLRMRAYARGPGSERCSEHQTSTDVECNLAVCAQTFFIQYRTNPMRARAHQYQTSRHLCNSPLQIVCAHSTHFRTPPIQIVCARFVFEAPNTRIQNMCKKKKRFKKTPLFFFMFCFLFFPMCMRALRETYCALCSALATI